MKIRLINYHYYMLLYKLDQLDDSSWLTVRLRKTNFIESDIRVFFPNR